MQMRLRIALAVAAVLVLAAPAFAALLPWEIDLLNAARADSLEASNELDLLLGEPELDPGAVPYVVDSQVQIQMSRDLIDAVLAAG